ncbi:phenylalanine--tRNA ligase subunit beta [Desmospora profundinema]|uniref:Phenylalanine--tRNA ligase beta subunit n=1 Tax=Desmospora profundinema TaxID=1571184 RepID=A0ABU1IP08_9BACL|nr:phenylalanine--tRNA ligase subunit beta [Desmospora profundinema]MDR6226526.1 phenylalanyl-tRNA synthetase beta chain [Desmospora profundinema]
MRVSYQWLRKYVDLEGVTPRQLAEALTRGGIEVDIVEARNEGLSHVVVGLVETVDPHPNADKLRVCRVDTGGEEKLGIVCGAANVAAGQKVPVALHGATLPGGIKIKKSKLRGVASQGMICSAKELGMPEKLLPKAQQEGILVLPEAAEVGQPTEEVLGLNDYVLELDLTPNRSDCLSMTGVAYEVAAVLDRTVTLPETLDVPQGDEIQVELVLEAEEDCGLYGAQVLDGIRIGTSPQWLQNRLLAAGIRPINNVVDVTNYVMLEWGQPLHAFDYDKLSGDEIVVRKANAGETITTLDGVTRACDDETLLITDGERPIAIAGVMGGEDSEVGAHTTRILLESAWFSPTSVRRTARKLGLRSEASNRFEKGVDPAGIRLALKRAVELLMELADARPVSPTTVEQLAAIEDVTITLRHQRLNGMLGVKIDESTVCDIFRRLDFPVKVEGEVYQVEVPSRRPDISIEVDLIEEVARLFGYDRIPKTLPWGQQSPGALTPEQRLRRVIRQTLRHAGLSEVINYSLTSKSRLEELNHPAADARPIRLHMPMSDERKWLRTTLIPQLLETAEYNIHRGEERVALFELSRVFITDEKKLKKLPEERWMVSALVTGEKIPSHWVGPSEPWDFFAAKGLIESLLKRIGVDGVDYQAEQLTGYHPGRTAKIRLDGEEVGLIGQLHPLVAEKHDLSDTIVFELELGPLVEAAQKSTVRFTPLPKYPATTRDLALVVDKRIAAGDLTDAIRETGGEILESVQLFDVFTGEQIGEGNKSVAYSLRYRSADKTLTDKEVNEVHDGIVRHLETRFGAALRS